MKNLYKTLLMLLLTLGVMLSACSKKSDPKPSGDLSAVSGDWTITAWGGEDGNPLNFTIDAKTGIGTITYLSVDKFNYKVGDQLYFNIKTNGDGTYSAKGKFTYGTDNANTSIRDCTLSLQNDGKQLTAEYPAITGFPKIIYIYQKGSTVEERL